jgi:hypothetical protein
MNHQQENNWQRDFLIIAGGQTVSLIGSAAVQFSLIWWLASATASPLMCPSRPTYITHCPDASSATMPLLLIAGPIAESRGVPLWFFVTGVVLLLFTLVSALLVLPGKVDQAG